MNYIDDSQEKKKKKRKINGKTICRQIFNTQKIESFDF